MAVAMQTWPGHPISSVPYFDIYAPPTRSSLPIAPTFASSAPPPQPVPIQAPEPPLPSRNTVELSRERLITVLTYFASLIPTCFNRPVRLVVHGGACMLLHPVFYGLAQEQHDLASRSPHNSPHNSLPRRTSTRDVDYLHRGFVAEWAALGVADAGERLRGCIRKTARQFGLGEDWMNSDPDISLPMAKDASGMDYDPIYTAAIHPKNLQFSTIFSTNNFSLVGVSLAWAVALKLVRYSRFDPGDICVILRTGTSMNNVQWTPETLERWLTGFCWPMGYSSYDIMRLQQMRSRIKHAVDMVSSWAPAEGPPITPGQTPPVVRPLSQPGVAPPPPQSQPYNEVFIPPLPGKPQPNTRGWVAQYPSQSQIQSQSQTPIPPPPQHRPQSSWATNPSMQMPVPIVPIPTPLAVPQPQQRAQPIPQPRPPATEIPSRDRDPEDDPRFFSFPRHHRTRDRERRPSTSHAHHRSSSSSSLFQPSWSWAEYQLPNGSAPNLYQPFQTHRANPTTPALNPTPTQNPNPPHRSDGTYARPRTQSHSYAHAPDPAAFERSVANALAEGRLNYDMSLSRHPGGPAAVLASMNTNVEVGNERRSKKKHRTKDRKRDRFAKLLSRNQEGDVSSGEDDDEGGGDDYDRGGRAGGSWRREDDRAGRGGRDPDRGPSGYDANAYRPPQGIVIQQPPDQQSYHPPTWHNNPLYAQPRPATTQPQGSAPRGLYYYGSNGRQEQDENHPPPALPGQQRARTPSPSREVRRKRSESHRLRGETSRSGRSRARDEERERGRSRSRTRSPSRHRPPPLVLSPLVQMESLRIF